MIIPKRLGRVAQELQREISQIILRKMSDPRLGFVTIIKVVPTVDLETAKVYISVLGDEAKKKATLDILNYAQGYIHKLLSERLRLRDVPRPIFIDSASRSEEDQLVEPPLQS